jgi:hypothetical protein
MHSTTALVLLAACPLAAQVLSTASLFQQGLESYQAGRYEDASRFLYAYIQRNPAELQTDLVHAAQVREAVRFSLDRLADMRNRLQRLELAAANQPGTGIGSKVSGLGITPPVLQPPGADNRASYPLVCRGGGNMRFSWIPQALGVAGPVFVIDFEKAPQGVGMDPSLLAPGQCSWRDRAIAPNEPSNVCARFEPSRFGIVWGTDGTTHGITSAAPKYVHELRRPDGWAVFDAYNNGNGCFIAKRGGE